MSLLQRVRPPERDGASHPFNSRTIGLSDCHLWLNSNDSREAAHGASPNISLSNAAKCRCADSGSPVATPSRSTQACAANFSPSFLTPIRNCVAMFCRASNHHKQSERSRQVEDKREFRAAARTMRAVISTRSPRPSSGATFIGEPTNLCRTRCVDRNPHSRRLMVSNGSSIAARKNNPFAGRGSALNRRRRANIGGLRLDQSIFYKMGEKVGKVRPQKFRLDLKFLEQLAVSRGNRRRGGHQLPHPGADRVQSKIALRFQIEQHRFLVQNSN